MTEARAARKAAVEFSFSSASEAEAFARAVAPEAHGVPETETSVSRRGWKMRIEIKTLDTPSMRAAVKSYLQWASCALEMQRLAGKNLQEKMIL